MAAPNIFVVYSIKDAKSKISTFRINFGNPATVNLGMVTAWATAVAPTIANLITGALVEIGVGFTLALPGGLPASPQAISDVEEGARFSYKTALNTVTGFRIPTFNESKMVSGTANVNGSDTDVVDLNTKMVLGHTVALETIQPTDERGEDVTAVVSMKDSFSKTRT